MHQNLQVMAQEKKGLLGVRCLQVPKNVDERGSLSVMEGGVDIPFKVARVFWITDVPAGQRRGGHAHWSCHEAVFAVAGGVSIAIETAEGREEVTLRASNEGVLIPAGAWCELYDFEPNTVLVVLASEHYRPEGYCHEKDLWYKMKNG